MSRRPNLRIAPADILGMPTPEQRLMKAIWGKPEVLYDRRQNASRRSSWRGGRRASDWPDEVRDAFKSARHQKAPKLMM